MKVPKASVHYREAESAQRCDTCSMYAPGTCTLVEGRIEPEDTCDAWEPDRRVVARATRLLLRLRAPR